MKKHIFLLFWFISIIFSAFSQPEDGDWQTRNSGNWNATDVWQIYSSGWSNTTLYPTGAIASTITILDGHTISATANITGAAGGQLIIASGGTLNMGIRVISGTVSGKFPYLEINGSLSTASAVLTTTIIVGSGGYFNTSYLGPNGWWASSIVPTTITLDGTVEFSGGNSQVIASPGSGNLNYYDLIISGTGTKYPAAAFIINGELTINNGTSVDLTGKGVTFTGTGLTNNGTLYDTYSGVGAAINLYNTTCSIGGTGTFPNEMYSLYIGELFITSCDATFSYSNELKVKYVTIDGSLDMEPTAKLTVTAALDLWTYSTAISLKSNASATASLIIAGSVSNNFGSTVAAEERYMSTDRWHIISSPLSDETISSFLSNNSNIPTSGSDRAMTDYDPNNDGWQSYFTGATSGNMSAGKGFLVRISSGSVVEFTGTPVTSTQSPTITPNGTGWNCVGNPFTSSIGISTDFHATNNFLTANASAIHDNYEALYVWNEQAGYSAKNRNDYNAINHASSQDYIQPGQGFIIKAAVGASSVSFTTAMQTHQNPTFYKKSGEAKPEIVLQVSDSVSEASTQIFFLPDMSLGLDPGYDAGLFGSLPGFSLYSKLVEDNGVDFMIQSLPDDKYDSLSIPIGFDYSTGGEVEFTATGTDLPMEYRILLEDRELGIYTDLEVEGASYTIHLPEETSGTGRFYLHTFDHQSVGIDLENFKEIAIYSHDKIIYLIGQINKNTQIAIYDLYGRELKSEMLEPSENNRINANELQTGIYIIRITGNNYEKTQKIFLK